ncbi:MAG: YicC/YloC family endoribonuclease [Oscillospiraceae bacterium]
MNNLTLSMTGYGTSTALMNGRDISVEIKSVNSRYFEYSSRLARGCAFMEDRFKKLLNTKISRGKVELTLTIQNIDVDDTQIILNKDIAKAYCDAIHNMAKEFKIADNVSALDLARFPDVFTVCKAKQDEDMLWNDASKVAFDALQRFIEMRAAEGAKLKEDILVRLTSLEQATDLIDDKNSTRIAKYIEKLTNRLRELLEDKNIDDARIVQEAALFADKTAVDEETVRLRSHIHQFRDILNLDEPVGRKLDFLTQELNRETNTIGSKVQELELTRIVVNMKSEIEKIREQIQNIE